MNLRKTVVFSLLFHILLIALMVAAWLLTEEQREEGDFFASLVPPQEVPAVRVPSIPPGPPPSKRNVSPPPSPAPSPGKELHGQRKALQSEPPRPSAPPGGFSRGPSPSTIPPGPGMNERNSRGNSPKERLFDKEIIGELSKKWSEKEEEESSRAFTFDASEYRFLLYNKKLKERIESIWVYPPDAAARGIYGDLVIKFTINRNGQLGAVELVRTSGHQDLDRAAVKALRDGAPYWPLPRDWDMDSYTIEGHFIYTIHGYYVM